MLRHVILHHNFSGKLAVAFECAHKEFERAREEDYKRLSDWCKERGEFPLGLIL